MESTTTRLVDLPNNMNNTQYTSSSQSNPSELSTNYVPINVHANPYGVSDKNPIMSHPEDSVINQPEFGKTNATRQVPQYLSEEQRDMLMAQEPQRLPSRHIQQDTTRYSHDEEVQPNYIPNEKVTKDYVREHEEFTVKNIQTHEKNNKRNQEIDDILTDIQVPIFVSILYFLFQLPIVNAYIFKRFSFLSIYNDDGNFNLYGLLLKSGIFGSIYYMIINFTNFLISL